MTVAGVMRREQLFGDLELWENISKNSMNSESQLKVEFSWIQTTSRNPFALTLNN